MKTKKIAVLGFGGRGHIYGGYAKEYPQKFDFVAAIDTNPLKIEDAIKNYGVKYTYSNYQDFLNDNLDIDIVAISTQDIDHKEHAIACMEKGYDLLLEKPIATTREDCLEILEYSKKLNRKVIVCHVLRYTPFYDSIKKIIDKGVLGDIITINASENIGYYHFAHSYVRGPWRNNEESSPIILAKCSHDMDIIRYLVGRNCNAVSSMGKLSFFTPENAPKNSAKLCSKCPVKDACNYNASKLYLEHKWMAGYFVKEGNSDEEILRDLEKSQYDKCVFNNDNDVVDHQVTIMNFEGGITATHTMTAFSKQIYRDIKIHGTKAELVGVMEDNYIEIRPFDGDVIKINVDVSKASMGGHSGGDFFMMSELHRELNGMKSSRITYLDVSVESHLMAFSAEESRLENGTKKDIKRGVENE